MQVDPVTVSMVHQILYLDKVVENQPYLILAYWHWLKIGLLVSSLELESFEILSSFLKPTHLRLMASPATERRERG